jgi:hypothetical protein
MDTKRPLELIDLQAKVILEGIDAPTEISKLGVPLTILAKRIDAKLTYRIGGNGSEYNVCHAIFDRFKLDDPVKPNLNILLIPDISKETGLANALADNIVALLTWQDFAHNAILGYISIVGSNDIRFDPLAKTIIHAPDLYLWQPITVNGKLYL